MQTHYIIYNGQLKKRDEKIFSINNRALLYGDGFFETIFAYNSEIPFLFEHYQRILEAFDAFFFNNSNFPDFVNLKQLIIYLARKNKLYKAYKARLTVFRRYGGLYFPTDNKIDYFISVEALEYSKFNSNKDGLNIDIFPYHKKVFSPISKFKTLNSLIFILAAKYAHNNNIDDAIILNTDNLIVETTNSNIFIVIDNQIITPKIEHGCVAGIMRHIIINILERLNLNITETEISEEILKNADEIFLSNAVTGIKNVKGYRQLRYKNQLTKVLIEELNKKLAI